MLESIQFPKYNAEIYLQGAHLATFKDWLFLSSESHFEEGKAIRGGIPIVFPYFGPSKTDKNLPQHGYARTAIWEVASQSEDGAQLILSRDGFDLQLTYTFGETLKADLAIENTGGEAKTYEVAYHTYLAVSDVKSVVVEGVDGKTYLDKTDGYARKIQEGNLHFEAETDRSYMDCGSPMIVRTPERIYKIEGNSLWKSTVTWNPFKSLADLQNWEKFVCVESGAVVDNALNLEAGGRHDLSIEISVL